MVEKIYINLSVRDLAQSVDFFTKLGFIIDKRFSDHRGASMVINETIRIMLMVDDYFNSFTNKKSKNINATSKSIIVISVGSRKEVNELFNKAIKAGATANLSIDYGWMKNMGFSDLDGHHWEVIYMDDNIAPGEKDN